MAGTKEFRNRIKSINNTRQITRAMEMISSIKMQKAIARLNMTRDYIQQGWDMLAKLAQLTNPEEHKLLQSRDSNTELLIVVASDKGLCGSYNADIIRKTTQYIKDNPDCLFIFVGKKTTSISRLLKAEQIIAQFNDFGKEIEYEEATPIAKLALETFNTAQVGKVSIMYSHFVSSLVQRPVHRQVLPIIEEHIDVPELWQKNDAQIKNPQFVFEPSAKQILDRILTQFIYMQIYGALLEANASEHSARMVAMKNANDNAKELIDELTLSYNSVRQQSITNEIAEISMASESMK